MSAKCTYILELKIWQGFPCYMKSVLSQNTKQMLLMSFTSIIILLSIDYIYGNVYKLKCTTKQQQHFCAPE